jgi:hypothetical protein
MFVAASDPCAELTNTGCALGKSAPAPALTTMAFLVVHLTGRAFAAREARGLYQGAARRRW